MNKLEYYLKDNPLTPDPTDFCAVVQHGKPVDDQELADMILYRSTGVAKSDIIRIIEEMKIALSHFLVNGRSLNTSLFNASFSIQGVFTDEEDRFDPARHTLSLNVKPGIGLKDTAGQVSLAKATPPVTNPILNSFTDTESGTKNAQITPGAPGKLNGKGLKFDQEDPLQGVFFINEANNREYKVDKFVECHPSKLIFKIPTGMAKSTYRLEVRKEAEKSGRLTAILQVA